MIEPLLQDAFADEGDLLFLELLDDLEAEGALSMQVPGGLQGSERADALGQREPEPVADLAEVRRPAAALRFL
jgi:hypothetical protein